jgi:antitoxin (DNA-binding transcriptional repressor) of toxin-antitoxin stability system
MQGGVWRAASVLVAVRGDLVAALVPHDGHVKGTERPLRARKAGHDVATLRNLVMDGESAA